MYLYQQLPSDAVRRQGSLGSHGERDPTKGRRHDREKHGLGRASIHLRQRQMGKPLSKSFWRI